MSIGFSTINIFLFKQLKDKVYEGVTNFTSHLNVRKFQSQSKNPLFDQRSNNEHFNLTFTRVLGCCAMKHREKRYK